MKDEEYKNKINMLEGNHTKEIHKLLKRFKTERKKWADEKKEIEDKYHKEEKHRMDLQIGVLNWVNKCHKLEAEKKELEEELEIQTDNVKFWRAKHERGSRT